MCTYNFVKKQSLVLKYEKQKTELYSILGGSVVHSANVSPRS